MLRLFRITDAFNVNKRQLAVRLSTTISALGVWEGNGAWSSPGRAGVTVPRSGVSALTPLARTYLLMAQVAVLAAVAAAVAVVA
jgi:hypothetical protein